MGWMKPRPGSKHEAMLNGAPKFEIHHDHLVMTGDPDEDPVVDDYELRQFLRSGSGLEPLMAFNELMLRSNEKPTILDIYACLEVWRQHIGCLFAGHSPRQQPAFIEKIRDQWNEVREMQREIFQACEKELERRKRAS